MERASSKAMEKTEQEKARQTPLLKSLERKKTVEFVGEVKQELKRVEWTSKQELKSYTTIVLLSTFLFGMMIYLIDLVIQGLLGSIQFVVRAIFG